MKRFLSSVGLCLAFLLVGLFFFLPTTGAQSNANTASLAIRSNGSTTSPEITLKGLLSLPAPPPPNPFYRPASNDRSENFLDKKNPPSDNAPIEDLLDYWKHQSQFDPKYTYTPDPSARTLERLMAEVERKPELLEQLVDVFPETKEAAEFVKRLYDEENDKRQFEDSWRSEVRKWLTYHSPYFSGELYQTASQAADTREYVTNQDEVLALARVDWEKAKPLLDRMLANSNAPVSQTLARWAYYKHAVANNDTFDIEKYRKELQETVENKTLGAGNRDLAMDALVEVGDFPGRDEWYYSLLEDETLHDLRVNGQTYTGLTTIINHSPDDKYVAKMIELAGSANQNIRNAAVRNLSTLLDDPIAKQNPDIVRALIPWLENPKWAKEVNSERMKIVTALRSFAIPESVPGLIAMLNEKEKKEVSATVGNANVTVNRVYSNSVSATVTADSYPFRSSAIMALEKQRSPLAAAPLRQLLGVVEGWERQSVMRAALVSNGFTVGEQIEALESIAKNMNQTPTTMPSNMATTTNSGGGASYVANSANLGYVSETSVRIAYNPNDFQMMLGQHLVNLEDPGEELVKAVIGRIALHEKKNPPLAETLRSIVQNWKGTAINALLLRDLRDGRTNLFAIIRLLTLRKELREKQPEDVNSIRDGSPTAQGIAACLLEQAEEYDGILNSESAEAKAAMLGCARLIRARLPVEKVAANLKSENRTLALAAERYLEAEDSPEARQIVLALHPNEAKILGARVAFFPEGDQSAAVSIPLTRELFISVDPIFQKFEPYYFYNTTDHEIETKLQAEVKENADLFGVYAYDNHYIRIYRDRVVFSWQDDPARYRERALTGEEFEMLKNFLARERVDELPPFLSACPSCDGKELLMLGKGGGRRVFVKADPLPQFFGDLENIFAEFRKQPAEIHYYLEKSVAGLEVLYADENRSAETVWKSGADIRLLTDDLILRRQYEREAEKAETETEGDGETEESMDGDENGDTDEPTPEEKAAAEKQRRENQRLARLKQYGSYTWFGFDRTKLLEPVAQPPGVEFIPLVDGFAVQPNDQQWKARAAGVEVRADEEGLYRIRGTQFAKIGTGYYYHPLVTPNGRWAVATKYNSEEEEYALVRVNLLTGREFKIKFESEYSNADAVANLPAPGKVLLFSSYGDSEEVDLSEREGEFSLLDVETGVVRPLGADARPLLQQTFRPLQSAGASADQLWAAIPDRENRITELGIYNARNFTFKPLLKIPEIVFGSMDMWVDEAEGKFYFVYGGHLLALPLPKNR